MNVWHQLFTSLLTDEENGCIWSNCFPKLGISRKCQALPHSASLNVGMKSSNSSTMTQDVRSYTTYTYMCKEIMLWIAVSRQLNNLLQQWQTFVSAKRHESHFTLVYGNIFLCLLLKVKAKKVFYICIFVATFKIRPNVWNPYLKLLKIRESCLQKRTTKCRDNLKRLSLHLQKLLVFFKNANLVSLKK